MDSDRLRFGLKFNFERTLGISLGWRLDWSFRFILMNALCWFFNVRLFVWFLFINRLRYRLWDGFSWDWFILIISKIVIKLLSIDDWILVSLINFLFELISFIWELFFQKWIIVSEKSIILTKVWAYRIGRF